MRRRRFVTYYKWKARCGGLEATDTKRLEKLEYEKSRERWNRTYRPAVLTAYVFEVLDPGQEIGAKEGAEL